jgi:hypothetical protein
VFAKFQSLADSADDLSIPGGSQFVARIGRQKLISISEKQSRLPETVTHELADVKSDGVCAGTAAAPVRAPCWNASVA